tara:strand:+ start:13 stop:540 length:528 start_codon:yes stop_codon:yes gene_type:complete
MNQEELNKYFSTEWTEEFDKYALSGYDLVHKCRKRDWVLDVGCGYNPFKGSIKNLVAIDPANTKADQVVTLEEFESDKLFDVAFCLGSINFGNETKIRNQIEKLLTHMKPSCKIFWRCNPGRSDHGKPSTHKVPFFHWSEQWHETFCKDYGFELVELGTEIPEPNKRRIYAEWNR